MKQKNKWITITTVGFALFAMFFGAGNLIIPPFIGLYTGEDWWLGLLGFFITAIFAPFLGVMMVAVTGNTFTDLGKKLPPILINSLALLIILCIGPIIAIPRTGATTYEVGFKPFFPEMNSLVFSVVFFALVFVLSISKTKIVDVIGKVLTPFLLLALVLLILMGVMSPVKESLIEGESLMESFKLGFTEGYQTLDVLASVIFAGLIISGVINSGYTTEHEKTNITIWAGVVSTVALLFVYGGLIYLGAMTDYQTEGEVARSELLLYISKSVLGHNGTFVISVAISLACLTTAIALTSATGAFFENISKGRISYRIAVAVCSIVSLILSVNSVEEIINYAADILIFIYPVTFTLLLLILVFGRKVDYKLPYVLGMLMTALLSLISVFENMKWDFERLYHLKKSIPLSSYNLEWLLPSVIAFWVGYIISKISQK